MGHGKRWRSSSGSRIRLRLALRQPRSGLRPRSASKSRRSGSSSARQRPGCKSASCGSRPGGNGSPCRRPRSGRSPWAVNSAGSPRSCAVLRGSWRARELVVRRLVGQIARRRGRHAEPVTALEAALMVGSAFPPVRLAGGAGLAARAAIRLAGRRSKGASKVVPGAARVGRGVAAAATRRTTAKAAKRAVSQAASRRAAQGAGGRAVSRSQRRAAAREQAARRQALHEVETSGHARAGTLRSLDRAEQAVRAGGAAKAAAARARGSAPWRAASSARQSVKSARARARDTRVGKAASATPKRQAGTIAFAGGPPLATGGDVSYGEMARVATAPWQLARATAEAPGHGRKRIPANGARRRTRAARRLSTQPSPIPQKPRIC